MGNSFSVGQRCLERNPDLTQVQRQAEAIEIGASGFSAMGVIRSPPCSPHRRAALGRPR